jgi:hypothetical protein
MYFITPIAHPSSILQGRPNLEPAQVSYLRRIAADPHPTLVDIGQLPPGCNPNPTSREIVEFTRLFKERHWSGVCLDIENAGPHLVCCGLMAVSMMDNATGPGVCIRFRKAGGDPWWPTWEEHLLAVGSLAAVLADPGITKVGHFSTQHDLPFLINLGFEVNGPLLDTAALLHAVHSELPKGLQFAATLFAGAPVWKTIKDEKDTADTDFEGDDK